MSNKYNDEFNDWLNNVNKEKRDDEYINKEYTDNDQISEEQLYSDDTSQHFNQKQTFGERADYSNDNEFRRDINEESRSEATNEDRNGNKKNKKSRYGFLKTVSLVLVGAILGSFLGPIASSYIFKNNSNPSIVQQTQQGQPISITTKDESNIENAVAKKSIQSVVGINVKFQSERSIFGESMQGEGIGSGIIVSENGYILTNAHVVGEKSTEINVIFSDNSHAKAEVVWKDAGLDLAVIKVEKNGLIPIEFANSDEIQIGDKAIAIGNPVGLNLQSTLTSGYISGLNRTISMQNGMIMNGLIQTDASINSGNSGGALLNSEGKLVGINTAKAGSTDGIGFAIPSKLAKAIVDKIIEKGHFKSIVVGIRGIDLVNYMQYTSNYDVGAEEGVYVVEVVEQSPAGKIGMKEGDIITKINDDKIISMNTLKQALIKYEAGDTAKITYIRDGKEKVSDVKFEYQEEVN